MRLSLVLTLFLVFVCQLQFDRCLAAPAFQQDTAQESYDDVEAIRARIPADDPAIKNEVETILQQVVANRKSTDNQLETAKDNQDAIEQVNAEVKKYSQEMGESLISKEDLDRLPLRELELLVQNLNTEVNANKTPWDEASNAMRDRISERPRIQEKLSQIDVRINDAQTQLNEIDNSLGVVSEAKTLELNSKIELIKSERSALTIELQRMDAEDRVDLPRIKSEYLRVKFETSQSNLEIATSALNEARRVQAKDVELQTRLTKLGNNPLLKYSFDENVQLAADNTEISGDIATSADLLTDKKKYLDDLKTKYKDARGRVRLIGLSNSVGALLRNLKDQLPTQIVVGPTATEFETELDEVQFQLFELDRRLRENNATTIEKEIVSSSETPSPKLDDLESEINLLVEQRETLLRAGKKHYQDHFDQLIQLEAVEKETSRLVKVLHEFINERILWIRSNDVLFSEIQLDTADTVAFRASGWRKVGQLLVEDWKENYYLYLIAGIGLFVLIVRLPAMRQAVDQFGQQAARGNCVTFWPTFKSFTISTLIALAFPLVPLFVGWRLLHVTQLTGESSHLVIALGRALFAVSWFAIPLEILRRFCRVDGLANKHFEWNDDAVKVIRDNLRWATLVGVVLVFFVAFMFYLDPRHHIDLIERSLFVVGMAVLAIVVYRTTNPETGIFRSHLQTNENSWASQLRHLWFGILLAIPAGLAVMAIVGYYYTSLNLVACVYATLVFGLIAETIRAMLIRFILIRRRAGHIEVKRRRRELQRMKEAEGEDESFSEQGELQAVLGVDTVPDNEMLADFAVDENALNSRKLIGLTMLLVWFFGLWMIWTDVLPALRALDRYPVWPPTVADAEPVAQPTLSPDGTPIPTEIATANVTGDSQETVITIRDVLVFFLIVVVTFLLASNLPSMIEIAFLKQLPVEPSIRYASKSIMSYLIVLLGCVLAFRSIQVGWSQVQWLATALTFGLAFGLQEIFANFVAGIILLFERPIRVGDVVTVDDVTGVVSRIRTRATTIYDWDRKEYIIPNKEFITGRIFNWTLTDRISRIVIEIGVAYGTDIDQAKTILLDVCNSHPKVMEEPSTLVTFERFDDSALILIVRTFVPDIDSRLTVVDQLHSQINDAFNSAGINICYPQQDVHIKSYSSETPDGLAESA